MTVHGHANLACCLQEVGLRTDASRPHPKATEIAERPGRSDRLGKRQRGDREAGNAVAPEPFRHLVNKSVQAVAV